jgi:ankyrin repeat protein
MVKSVLGAFICGMFLLVSEIEVNAGLVEDLQWAILSRDIDRVKTLLDEMTPDEIGTTNARNSTILHFVAQMGNAEIIELLLGKVSPEQIGRQDAAGYTALHWAVLGGNVDTIPLLLDKMTPNQIDAVGITGDTALGLAVRDSSMEIVELLLENILPGQIGVKAGGTTVLHLAVLSKDINRVRIVLKKMLPEQIGATDFIDNTALHLALQLGQKDIIMSLLQVMSPEQVNISSKTGYKALHLAISSIQQGLNGVDIVQAIVDKMPPEMVGSRTKTEDDNDVSTPLMLAVYFGYGNIIPMLLEKMSLEQIASLNRYGHTALQEAAIGVHEGILEIMVEQLLRRGCTPQDIAFVLRTSSENFEEWRTKVQEKFPDRYECLRPYFDSSL